MNKKRSFTAEEARRVREALGLGWGELDVKQYGIGMNVELEHGKRDALANVTNDGPTLTGEIALAHLKEFPDYYTRLSEMEKEAEKSRERKGARKS